MWTSFLERGVEALQGPEAPAPTPNVNNTKNPRHHNANDDDDGDNLSLPATATARKQESRWYNYFLTPFFCILQAKLNNIVLNAC